MEFLPGRQGLVHTSEFAQGEGLDDFKLNDKVDVTLAGVGFHLLQIRECSLMSLMNISMS